MNLTLFLNTDEADPRLARVVSLSDLSRLPLPLFSYGDRLNVSIYLITSAGAYHADSTDSSLARTLTLGLRGSAAVAQTSTFTAISNGFSCTLDLDSTQLALLLRAARTGTLALVHKTTGSGPNPTRRCSLDATILGDVETVGDGTSLSAETYYTASQINAFLLGLTTADAVANASGDTTLTLQTTEKILGRVITFSGSAGTRRIVLADTNAVAGCLALLNFVFPATTGIIVELWSGSTAGTLLASVTSDGTAGTVGLVSFRGATAWAEPCQAAWLD